VARDDPRSARPTLTRLTDRFRGARRPLRLSVRRLDESDVRRMTTRRRDADQESQGEHVEWDPGR
jgi:hypothetical protein